MSTETHTNSTASRYCWNICSDSTVRVILFCGGLWWTIRYGFPTLNQKENQQACNEDISFFIQRMKKFKSQALTGKVILTVFFDIKGPLFLDCKSCSDTVSANCYCHVAQQLHTKIKKNFWDEFADVIILLHVNAHPHIAQRVQGQLNATGSGEGGAHTSPCNFYISGPFKKALKGHTFTSYDNLHKPVVWWFRQQMKEIFADGICIFCINGTSVKCLWWFFPAVPSTVSILRQASVIYASYFEHFQVTWYFKKLEILLTNTRLVYLNTQTPPLPTHHTASNSLSQSLYTLIKHSPTSLDRDSLKNLK